MADQISSGLLNAHEQILSDLEAFIYGLRSLEMTEPENDIEREHWTKMLSLYVDMIDQSVIDLRSWSHAACSGHDFNA